MNSDIFKERILHYIIKIIKLPHNIIVKFHFLIIKKLYPYSVQFCETKKSYDERYNWICKNIKNYEKNVYVDAESIVIWDSYSKPSIRTKGVFRFYKSEDAIFYRITWNEI